MDAYFIADESTEKTKKGFFLLNVNGIFVPFKAVSSEWGKGFLPAGMYDIVSCYTKEDNDSNKAFRREGFPWIAGLIPRFKTEHSNLAIHPDGNVPGTLGCI